MGKPMKWVAVLGVLLLAACATPSVDDFKQQMIPNSQIQIQDRFDTREINVESYAAEVVRCFPEVKIDASRTESIQKALDNAQDFVQAYGHIATPRLFAFYKNQAWCMPYSEGGWPILAGEVLQYTVDPIGPSPAVIAEWNRQIVLRLATVGEVRVAYNMPDNRHAVLVTYWLGRKFPRFELHYRHQQRIRGTWEHEHLDLQFTHVQLKDIKTVKWGEGTVKPNPIAHRYHHLPR